MDSHDCDGLPYGFFIVASFDVELVDSIGGCMHLVNHAKDFFLTSE